MPWTTEQVTAALAAVGGVCGGAGAAIGKWREARRQEKKDEATTALAAEDLKLKEIKELYRVIGDLRTWQERMAVKQEQTEQKLDATESKLDQAEEAIRKCEQRDAQKAVELEATRTSLTSLSEKYDLLLKSQAKLEGHQEGLQREHLGVVLTATGVQDQVTALTQAVLEEKRVIGHEPGGDGLG